MFSIIFRAHFPQCRRFCALFQQQSKYSNLFNKLFRVETPKIIKNKENFRVIYEFQYIGFPAFLIRLKYTLPILAVPLVPLTFAFDSTGQSTALCVGACFVQLGILIVASRFLKNVIGKVYVNREGDVKDIIVSVVNEKGARVDNLHNVSDIITVAFSSRAQEIVGFASVFIRDSETSYKLATHKNAYKCHSPKIMKKLFGLPLC